ncbi:MAG TPA: hypothetical protein DD734_02760 [Firmicutes bacterium]|nr:hypothetical protein [Bacillota bacterium]HBR33525.1 hypothetical protein [Bacillota bacterium]
MTKLTDHEQTAPLAAPEQETKERILQAALVVFGEKGYHPATMAEIAEAARVGKGTLYWHFSSKEDLFYGMIAQLAQEINVKLRSILTTERPFPDLLLVFIKEFLNSFDHHRDLTQLNMSMTQGLSNELREKLMLWHEQFLAINTELIELGLKLGFFRPDLEVKSVVTAFTGILFAFGGRQCLEENWNQVETKAVFIKDMLTHGIAK